MGKGITAALIGAATKNQFLRAINQLLLGAQGFHLPDTLEIIRLVHRHMTSQLLELESFVTICYLRVDLDQKVFQIINCGHPRLVHYEKKDRKCRATLVSNMPLGLSEEAKFRSEQLSFSAGDILFLYSDGLTEARNEEQEPFGEERLIEVVTELAHLPAQPMIRAIHQQIVAFTGSRAFVDDLTCLAIKFSEN